MAEDRSLSSGMSFPQWMKNRINDRTFDQNTFSPPQTDDSFLYIKYKRSGQESPAGQSIKPQILHTVSADPTTVTDFSKHTDSCKKFIDSKIRNPIEVSKDVKLKSNGTDDGFKGDAAACGSSVIRVAHQMVNAKFGKNNISNISTVDEEPATEPLNFNRALRRGSKSLPSSPLTSPNSSPKSRRKMPNKYFGAPTLEGGWILSGLLRKTKLSQSVSVINEEDTPIRESLMKSVSQMSVDGDLEQKVQRQKKTRATELREMNFYSPTSM